MIGTIGFYRLPGSITAGEHPVLTSRTSTETAYRVKSVSSAKFTKDFQQRILVSEFDDWTTCNMVRLSSGSWIGWYWITDRSQSSIASGGVEFAIEFAPITSMLEVGDELSGYWTRAPTNISPWKGQAVMSGAMQVSRTQVLIDDAVVNNSTTYALMWCTVTTTDPIGDDAGNLQSYGFPVAVRVSGSRFNVLVLHNADTGHQFPQLFGIINNPSEYGIDATAIQDISLCEGVPWAYTCIKDSTNDWQFDLSGSATTVSVASASGGVTYDYYDNILFAPKVRSGTLSLSTMENDCGTVAIRDSNGSMMFSVPTAWTTYSGGSYKLDWTIQTWETLGQQYHRLSIGGQIVQIPGVHLPYAGSAWDTYKAYSQAFDRESMEFSIRSAADALNVQTNAQVANAGLSAIGSALKGDIGGVLSTVAGTGISVATSYRLQDISNAQTRFAQDLTERRLQAQPATAYNLADGLSGVYNRLLTPLCLAVSLPAGLTSSIYSNFVSRFGYSVEGFDTLTVGTGFYQGNLMPADTMCGGEFDRLNETLNAGVYLVEI